MKKNLVILTLAVILIIGIISIFSNSVAFATSGGFITCSQVFGEKCAAGACANFNYSGDCVLWCVNIINQREIMVVCD